MILSLFPAHCQCSPSSQSLLHWLHVGSVRLCTSSSQSLTLSLHRRSQRQAVQVRHHQLIRSMSKTCWSWKQSPSCKSTLYRAKYKVTSDDKLERDNILLQLHFPAPPLPIGSSLKCCLPFKTWKNQRAQELIKGQH